MAVVERPKDQVRWLRLRAVALSGASVAEFASTAFEATARTLPVNKDCFRLTQVGQDPGVAVEAT